MKETLRTSIAAILTVATMCGCASVFGIRSNEGARAWAESKSRSLSRTIRAQTPLPPQNRSFLIGTWRTKTRSQSVDSQSEGENWMELDLTYRFSDDGTFVCDTLSSSKFGRFTTKGIHSSLSGTWSYEGGKMTMLSNVPHVGRTRERYNVIWYGNDEFELRPDFESIKDIRDFIGKAMQEIGWKQQSCVITCSDQGVSASWSEYVSPSGVRRHFASVWTPSIMKREAGSPRPVSPIIHPVVSPEGGKTATPQSAKWRLVEKANAGKDRVSFTFELSDGGSAEVAHSELLPWVCNNRKDAFLQANPEVDPGSVHVTADYEMRNGGRTLVYTAATFTTQPIRERFEYSERTRRGFVSYRFEAHGNVEAANDFAKRDIEKIVSNANVVLEVGQEVPPGAKYRELDQDFRDNVFTLWFEAIE